MHGVILDSQRKVNNMKLIKFDLPIDGIKAKNIEELQKHFTIEILSHYRSGLLAKWLRSRSMTEELAALASLDGLDEHASLKRLCEIFDVEIDDAIVSALLDESADNSAKSTIDVIDTYDALAKSIDHYVFYALRMNLIATPEDGIFNLTSNECLKKGDVLISVNDLNTLTPVAGRIFLKTYVGAHKRSKGAVVGMFLMSEFMDDWDHDFLGGVGFIRARADILNFFANEDDKSSLLRDALLRRTNIIRSVASVLIDEFNKNKKISSADLVKVLSADQLNCVWLKNAT